MKSPNHNPTEHAVEGQERGCGQRLRAAREAAGLSVIEVAGRLKMPVRIVEALEAEDWTRIGASVFVRGQLRSYSRLLGLPTEPVQMASGISPIEPTRLVSRTHTPRFQRIADQVGSRFVYIVITALIMVPVWMATRSHLDSAETGASLDAPPENPALVKPSAKPPQVREPSTVIASMASMPSRPAEAPELSLHLSGDSWVQIVAPDGHTVEEALLKEGDVRSYPAATVGRMVLGNAGAVQVQRNGDVQDLTPYMRASVARFTVSSDGSLAPVSE